MTLNEYFDKIICINLDRRPDRWVHAQGQFSKYELTVDRFAGCDFGAHDGNRGCTESHAAVLRLIAKNGWARTLILEDDFEFRFDDIHERFTEYIREVPHDWWMLYLGGHYGNERNVGISEHIIRFNHMKTTSTYAVTLKAATAMWPHISGIGPIDECYYYWHMEKPCYIFTPRLATQYTSYSDLQRNVMNYDACMTDNRHELLVDGIIRDPLPPQEIQPPPKVVTKRFGHDTVAY